MATRSGPRHSTQTSSGIFPKEGVESYDPSPIFAHGTEGSPRWLGWEPSEHGHDAIRLVQRSTRESPRRSLMGPVAF